MISNQKTTARLMGWKDDDEVALSVPEYKRVVAFLLELEESKLLTGVGKDNLRLGLELALHSLRMPPGCPSRRAEVSKTRTKSFVRVLNDADFFRALLGRELA